MPELFSNYMAGLHDAGWSGDEWQVRLGFSAQFSIYVYRLLTIVEFNVQGISDRRKGIGERRLGAPMEAWPRHLARIAPSLVWYADELEEVVKRALGESKGSLL